MEQRDMRHFVMGILIVGLTLVMGIYIAATMEDNFLTPNTAGSIVNESVTAPTPTGVTLAVGSDPVTYVDGACGTITSVYNGTGSNYLINSGNYTQSGCVLTNTTDTSIYSATWIISYPYTYSADTNSSIASAALVTSLSSGSSWITILVVVGFAVIVLGMLSEGLGNAARRSGSPQFAY